MRSLTRLGVAVVTLLLVAVALAFLVVGCGGATTTAPAAEPAPVGFVCYGERVAGLCRVPDDVRPVPVYWQCVPRGLAPDGGCDCLCAVAP